MMANERIQETLADLMLLPGLSGYEDRVRRYISEKLNSHGIKNQTDRLGNLIAKLEGNENSPSVMVFAHMDQLGFIVSKIECNGLIKIVRLGGVPEKILASQAVLICPTNSPDIDGVIYNKSHHATNPEEKYLIGKIDEMRVDAGFQSSKDAENAGVQIGTPIVYRPTVIPLSNGRIAGTSIDDRAGCSVLLELAKILSNRKSGPTVYLVFSVLEEFNLRGAVVAAQNILPDIAIQIDLMVATDTPEMEENGSMELGAGPGMSMYSFHGRGTLNGVIPHPAIVDLVQKAADENSIPLQRSARVGVLTDLSYVQLVGQGVASIDLGFPMRYSHSSLEICDLRDLEMLTRLLATSLERIGHDFNLSRDSRMS